jgi:hypothetical protein
VILVFFLLFTAVFSNTNILELNLPAPNSSVPELPKGLQLEVIVRKNVIEIADRNSGVLRSLPRKEGEYDYKGLSDFLQFVKSKYPTVMAASVLMEQDIPYDVLVQTMDNVRLFEKDDAPLFTKVGSSRTFVGDAPLVAPRPQVPAAGVRKPRIASRSIASARIRAATWHWCRSSICSPCS